MGDVSDLLHREHDLDLHVASLVSAVAYLVALVHVVALKVDDPLAILIELVAQKQLLVRRLRWILKELVAGHDFDNVKVRELDPLSWIVIVPVVALPIISNCLIVISVSSVIVWFASCPVILTFAVVPLG